MIVSLIAALDEAGGIGKEGKLPWHLSADLKNFKALTMGHHLIEGRKTYESIGRPLPGRTVILITRNMLYSASDCLVVHSLTEALDLAKQRGESEAFISGGAEIFALALPLAQRIYLTRVHTRADCDVFFPQVDWAEWREVERVDHAADEKNEFAFTVLLMERITEALKD